MNESMQEYRTILADNPAKAEKQLYKLAKKGDLNALSALNEYYEKCVTEAKTPKELSRIRQKALKAAMLGAAQNSPYWLIWREKCTVMAWGRRKMRKRRFPIMRNRRLSVMWMALLRSDAPG